MIVVNASVFKNILPSMVFGKSATVEMPTASHTAIHRHTHSKQSEMPTTTTTTTLATASNIGIQPTPFGCMVVWFGFIVWKKQHRITFYLCASDRVCAYTRREKSINKTICNSRRLPNLQSYRYGFNFLSVAIECPTKHSNFAGGCFHKQSFIFVAIMRVDGEAFISHMQ